MAIRWVGLDLKFHFELFSLVIVLPLIFLSRLSYKVFCCLTATPFFWEYQSKKLKMAAIGKLQPLCKPLTSSLPLHEAGVDVIDV